MSNKRVYFTKNNNLSIAAGASENVLFVPTSAEILQLSIRVDGDNTTGSNDNKLIISGDNRILLKETFYNLALYYSAYSTGVHNAPFLEYRVLDLTNKVFALLLYNLGKFESNFKVDIENADTTNSLSVWTGLILKM